MGLMNDINRDHSDKEVLRVIRDDIKNLLDYITDHDRLYALDLIALSFAVPNMTCEEEEDDSSTLSLNEKKPP